MTAGVGDEIEATCPKCGGAWHIVVAKVADRIACLLCRTCGKQYNLSATDSDPRLVDPAETRRVARRVFESIATCEPVKLARMAAAGKQLDALHVRICGDVTAELGAPARSRKRWSMWQATGALLFVVQIDEVIAEAPGLTVTLLRVPWTEADLPAIGANAADWITNRPGATRS